MSVGSDYLHAASLLIIVLYTEVISQRGEISEYIRRKYIKSNECLSLIPVNLLPYQIANSTIDTARAPRKNVV